MDQSCNPAILQKKHWIDKTKYHTERHIAGDGKNNTWKIWFFWKTKLVEFVKNGTVLNSIEGFCKIGVYNLSLFAIIKNICNKLLEEWG